MRRNLFLYVLYRILTVEGICHGLFVWWLVFIRHMSAAQVGVGQAIGDGLLALLEVPTGRLADRYGRRLSMAVGSVLQCLGLYGVWRGPALAGLWLVAAGDAFRSGAQEALLFESCQALGEVERFGGRLATSQTALLVAMGLMTTLGGAAAGRWSGDAAWGLELTVALAGLAVVGLLQEPPRAPSDGAVSWHLPRPLWTPIGLGTVCCGAASLAAFLMPLALGNRPQEIAMWMTSFLAGEALGSWVARHVRDAHRGLWVSAGLAILCLLDRRLYGGTFLAVGAAVVLRMQVVYAAAADTDRATLGSAAGFCDLLLRIALLSVAGLIPH